MIPPRLTAYAISMPIDNAYAFVRFSTLFFKNLLGIQSIKVNKQFSRELGYKLTHVFHFNTYLQLTYLQKKHKSNNHVFSHHYIIHQTLLQQ